MLCLRDDVGRHFEFVDLHPIQSLRNTSDKIISVRPHIRDYAFSERVRRHCRVVDAAAVG